MKAKTGTKTNSLAKNRVKPIAKMPIKKKSKSEAKSHPNAHAPCADEIRAAGLKLTPVRVKVLELLKQEHCLLTIDEIVKRLSLSEGKSKVDWTTVYRTLLTFTDAGLVTPTTLVDGALRYEYQHASHEDHHHHHHVSCKKCGMIESIDACEIEKIQKQVEKMGFRELSHRLEFTGVCPKCR